MSIAIRKLFTWILVLVTLVAGRPATGCICDDGHYDPFCTAYLNKAPTQSPRTATPSKESASPVAGCPHCRKTAEPTRPSEAASAAASGGCCNSADATAGRTDRKGCTPAVQTPAVAATLFVAPHSIDFAIASSLPVAPIATWNCQARAIHLPAFIETGPPVDRNLAFGRMLI